MSRRSRRPLSLKPAVRIASSPARVARSARQGDIPIAPRIAVAGVIGGLLFGVLMLRLWALTVLGGAEYAERADRNQLRLLPVEAPRGQILDRTGRAIVTNRPARQVIIDLQLAGTPEEVDATLVDLAWPLGVPVADLRKRVAKAPPGALEPVVLVDDVPTRDDAKIWWLAEHEADFPGVRVANRSMRKYPHGKLAAHVLGFVGSVSPEELETSHTNLEPTDRVGKAGIERTYDQFLRGANGYQSIQVDAAGTRQDGTSRGLPATPGRNLQTTIDLKVQKTAEQSLKAGIARAARTADGRDANSGAVVAMDIKNGGVLAMASAPTFDPAIFTDPKRSDEVTRLYNTKSKAKPSINLAIQGEYPPASTYKVITGFAAMAEDYVGPTEELACEPVMKIANHPFKNHDTEHGGYMDMATALETSCDTYFYKLAIKFYQDPQDPLQRWSRKFGLGAPTGFDLGGEASGLVPTVAWLHETFGKNEPWLPGYSVNMSIGQGDLKTTPLQMTNVFATIANGGTLHTPHIGASIREPSGREARVLDDVDNPVDLKLNPVHLSVIRDGLYQVANGGRGTAAAAFADFPITTAGKSGTGEKLNQSDLAWYCGYAPYDKPEIAACAFIDGGGGGSAMAAPIVRDLFETWFSAKLQPKDKDAKAGTDAAADATGALADAVTAATDTEAAQ